MYQLECETKLANIRIKLIDNVQKINVKLVNKFPI